MNRLLGLGRRARATAITALALVMAAPSIPAMAQSTSPEARIQRMEAEIRALQRKVFPSSDGKTFTPEIAPSTAPRTTTGQPATTAMTDLLSRMDALEGQLTRLTSQVEQNSNKIAQIEARLGGQEAPGAPAITPPAGSPAPAPAVTPPPAASTNLSAMTGGASAPKPATAPAPAAAGTAKVTPAAAAPSAQRVAAVRAIEKPQTGDAPEDEYSYGFRLWEAKFYPEAQQQLKLMIDKYPRYPRMSYARNLLGRAYLDDGKPREAANWFLQNYQANKNGERAPDSLLYLAESMRRLKDSNRACIALAEFGETYPAEAASRLKGQYDQTRTAVKCN